MPSFFRQVKWNPDIWEGTGLKKQRNQVRESDLPADTTAGKKRREEVPTHLALCSDLKSLPTSEDVTSDLPTFPRLAKMRRCRPQFAPL